VKFCKSCKGVFHSSEEYCPACRKKLRDITDINEPVRLCVIGGTERTMLCGLLNDAGIPYIQQNDMPQGVANEIVTGYDVKLNNIAVMVPFQALPEAIGLLGTIETVENKLEPMQGEIIAHITALKSKPDDKGSNMSPAMRTTVKVLSAIAFLILVALVVLGTDKITELIKGLFGG
jgi:hypothetical protein